MKTIAFYSYKGGTGRSLLLANYARYLAYCGKSVILLDFDLEAPGLHHKFLESGELQQPEWEKKKTYAGVQKYLEICQAMEQAPEDLKKYFLRLEFAGGEPACYLMPAGEAPTHDYASRNLKLDWKKFFPPDKDSPPLGVNVFLNLRNRIEAELRADFLLIDSRTGITDIGTVAVAFMPNVAVCLFLCNPENFAGTKLMLDTLERVKKNVNTSLEVIPIVTRIPCERAVESRAIDQARSKLGPFVESKELFVLHEELSLHVCEELVFGSNKTLLESPLLRDYLNIFTVLDDDTAKRSSYYEVMKQIGETDFASSKNDNENDAAFNHLLLYGRSDRIATPSPVLVDMASRDAKLLRYAQFSYVSGQQYGGLIEAIRRNLGERIRQDAGTQPTSSPDIIIEKEFNWDHLPILMRMHYFDFLSEPYLLTQYRSLSAGVVQYGWVNSFTCFFRNSNFTSRSHGCKFGDFLDPLKDREEVLFGLMGNTAASDEATKNMANSGMPISGRRLSFHRDPEALWNWLQQAPESHIVVCDHIVARKIAKDFAEMEATDYAFAPSSDRKDLVFPFERPIPVGFIYPIGDRQWRYAINQAFAEAILNKPEIWEARDAVSTCVRKDLQDSGIDPFSFEQLSRYLIWGMKPEDALKWI